MKSTPKYVLLDTKELNKPTIKVVFKEKSYLMYSKYSPTRDSQAFAREVYCKNIKNYLIYGLGLGYHIQELEDLIKCGGNGYHIYIIECNKEILEIATSNIDLGWLLKNKNITLIIIEDNHKSYKRLSKIMTIDNLKIATHNPSLNVIPEKFIELKYLLEEFVMKQNTMATYSHSLSQNYKSNINLFDDNVDTLFNNYINKPVYIVAAGPSLDRNIHELAKIKDDGIILSVGRAVRSLLEAEIRPDYIVITDPSSELYNMQLKGLDIEVPIIILSTCDENVMLNYKGKKYIALQNGYLPAEEYAKINNHVLVNTGGSVATTGLDIAIKMGGNPIIFVGQDLAFTDDKTHSKDALTKEVVNSNILRNIEDVYGQNIQTSKNLYIYLRWIQNRIAEEKDTEFIDATEGGARIDGTKIMKLNEIINRLAIN